MYIVIAGGGKVGSYLANVLLESGNQVAIIEENKQVADLLSVSLEGECLVINGDGCDSRFQEDAGMRRADIFVGATGQDDTNLVACEIAGCVFNVNRVIARVNSPKNLRIFRKVGIECVSSTTLIANLIEEEALLGNVSVVSSLTHGNVSLSEFTVGHMRHHSDEEGVALGDVELPEGALAVAVAYEDDAEVANDDIILFPGDQVIVVADSDVLDEVRAVFRSL
ncbi:MULTISPECIES: TrkA family potassium uptake protein [unclassified Adlercreutzia]|uniref:potassium channel family protein n=1 Tax=unclassified Adlercreutzia TaxID=2636013 RepID=UPI0013EB4FFA|nr:MULTISPECIES: TrkA family potassium uptake protein [unclassified Adlercreutzia]